MTATEPVEAAGNNGNIEVSADQVIRILQAQISDLSLRLATSEAAREVMQGVVQAQRTNIDAMAARLAHMEDGKDG